MTDNTSKLANGTPAGSAATAGSGCRDEQLLNDLEILAVSYDRPTDHYRRTLLQAAIRELEACYSTIDALDHLVTQLEKESKCST
jgi:hypothetical protein